ERTEDGEDPKEVMDDLELERYCCRRMFTAQVDLIDEINKYSRMGP
ncbi:MAG: DNA-directed RNA polymerase subunit N, partial [archaeon]